jgi:hypothetical protein
MAEAESANANPMHNFKTKEEEWGCCVIKNVPFGQGEIFFLEEEPNVNAQLGRAPILPPEVEELMKGL